MHPPSSSERITITRYNSCNGSYHIDRTTIPPFVNHKEFRGGAITALEWQEFCHLVECNLRSINHLRDILKVVLACTAIVLLAFIIFIFFGYDQPTLQYFEDHRFFWLMPVFAGVLTTAGIILCSHIANVTRRTFHTVARLCEEQSKVLATAGTHTGPLLVSFHLCDERSEKGFDVQANEKSYTGNDYFHHPFRTYHNVYILAVVTMVDEENPFAASFVNPFKFPTIEFESSTDNDDSTLGESTIYTSFGADMTVTEDIVRSNQRSQAKVLGEIPSQEGKTKKQTQKQIANTSTEEESRPDRKHKKGNKKKMTSKAKGGAKAKKTEDRPAAAEKGKKKGHQSKSKLDASTDLHTIMEAT